MKKQDAINKAGGNTALAELLGITQSAVAQWRDNVPWARELQLRFLRPEWFPKKKAARAEPTEPKDSPEF